MAQDYEAVGSNGATEEEATSVQPPMRRKMSGTGAAMLAGSWPPEMEMVEPTVNLLVFFQGAAPSLDLTMDTCQKHLWPCFRFRSCMGEGGYWVPWEGPMDKKYHFAEVQVPNEAAIDEWVQTAMFTKLDRNYPPWRITLLRTAQGRSAAWFQVHHCVGDGLGLIFAFFPLIRCEENGVRVDPFDKIPLPSALKPRSRRTAGGGGGGGGGGNCLTSTRYFFKGLFMSLITKHDAELSINAPIADRTPFLKFNNRRVMTRFPPVSMEVVKEVRSKSPTPCTVNDVVMAALTGALRRYGAEVGNDPMLKDEGPDEIEFKSMFMIALPRELNEENLADSLCNNILFASCNLPIGDHTARGRLDKTIETFNNLKSKQYVAGLAGFTKFVTAVAPVGALRKAVSETFSKHTLLVTNVPATTCPMVVPDAPGGQMATEFQMVFPNAITQVSIISYNGMVHSNIVADPSYFAQPAVLGKFFAEEFAALAK